MCSLVPSLMTLKGQIKVPVGAGFAPPKGGFGLENCPWKLTFNTNISYSRKNHVPKNVVVYITGIQYTKVKPRDG